MKSPPLVVLVDRSNTYGNGQRTLWSAAPAAQGTKATQAVATRTSGVYTRAKRCTSVSVGDCAAAACSTSRAICATALAAATAVVSTCRASRYSQWFCTMITALHFLTKSRSTSRHSEGLRT